MELKQGYKQTEVGVIPEEWNICFLHQVCERVTVGLATSVTQYYRKSGVPLVRNLNIRDGFFDGRDMLYVTEAFARVNQSKAAKASDVLIVHTGANLGDACVLPSEFDNCQTFTTLIITPKPRALTPQFLCLHMGSFSGRGEMSRLEVGGGKGNLNTGDLKNYRISVPPLPEQHAIAAALKDVDALITSLDQLIAKKRDLKQAAMQQLFTGNRRLSGFTSDWETKRLGEIAKLTMGRTPSRLNRAFWGRGHKWLSIADLKSKVISQGAEEITDLAASEMTVVPKGTLLMSFKLTIGRICFAGCDLFTNEAICAFHNLQADAQFLYYALGRIDFSIYGKQAVKGYTLNADSLQQVEVHLPHIDEQTAIANVLSDMDAEITALEARRDKTHALKQGMMQELLTGRTRLV